MPPFNAQEIRTRNVYVNETRHSYENQLVVSCLQVNKKSFFRETSKENH